VPPGDATALAEGMLRLARDSALRSRMGQAALERYQKLFSPKLVVPIMIDTYQRIVRTGPAAEPLSGNRPEHPWVTHLNSPGTQGNHDLGIVTQVEKALAISAD